MASPKDPSFSPAGTEPAGTTFYVTGGTLRPDAPSYVERRADHELLEGLVRGEFCYVLTSRQMGKSSLMVRTAQKLRPQGINVIVLDLTAIGQNLTPEQWYDGLLLRLGRQLRLEDEMEHFWRTHERIGPVQRFISAIHDVALAHRPGPLVIFVDEIDVVRNLPFPTDEFFAAIRECHNRRGVDPALRRLTFCLLGVVTPSDLIQDTRTTPFNVGRRIELTDFTEGEAATLLPGLRFGNDDREDMDESDAREMLRRVLHWTGGHPYLTQRLCRAVAERNDGTDDATRKLRTPKAIDQLCDELFLATRSRERDDNLLFVRERMLRSEVDRAGLIDLYLNIHRGGRVPDDEHNPLIAALRLSGVARTGRYLEVRNRIYREVFDRAWAVANLPDPEKRRQREAFRRGALRGAFAGAVALVIGVAVWLGSRRVFEARAAHQSLNRLVETYSTLRTYQDHAEIEQDLAMEGTRLTSGGTLSLAVQKPDKLRLTADLRNGFSQIKLEVVRRGNRVWVHLPLLHVYQTWETTNSLVATLETVSRTVSELMSDSGLVPMSPSLRQTVGRTAGGFLSESAHRFALSDDVGRLMAREAPDRKYHGRESVGGSLSYVFTWHRPDRGPGMRGAPNPGRRGTNDPPVPMPRRFPGRGFGSVPTTIWVSGRSGLINQMTTDWSKVPMGPPEFQSGPTNSAGTDVREFTFTTRHTDIRLNDPIPEPTFEFVPPPNSREIERLDATTLLANEPPASSDVRPESEPRLRSIPARSADAPSRLVDLSAFYNASLDQTSPPGRPGNDLRSLPHGLQTIGGVPFDIRGKVQLASASDAGLRLPYRQQVQDIAVGRRCARLHFLHGAAWSSREGTHVGSYVVHYADGEQRVIPLLYGYDVRDWWTQSGEPRESTGLEPVWTGANRATRGLRLYLKTWANPRPEVAVTSLDFVSTLSPTAPFLIAVTAEDGD